MDTRKRNIVLAIIAAVLAVIVAFAFRASRPGAGPETSTAAIPVDADVIDPDNEGRLVSVHGQISVDQPAEDPQLGLRVPDAIVLVREVEMFQWQQACNAGSCTLTTTWSPVLIDSTNFSEPGDHRNPDRFPIATEQFVARGVRLGAFFPAAGLLVSSGNLAPRPVTLAELSNNLAASFSVSGGALVSGNDPEHPVVGDLRIRYLTLADGVLGVTGIQHSSQLIDPSQQDKP